MCNAYNHPPGCTCGWGGEGHLGGGHGGGYGDVSAHSYASANRVRDWDYQDFTRPTKCPECGEDVFFIRHNGGSVWVDELGWPWPKHACFDSPNTETFAFSRWSLKASGLKNPKLGVVSRIRPSQNGHDRVIEVNLNDSSRLGLLLAYMPSEDSLLGALVCISRKDNLLLHPIHGEIAIHSLFELSLPPWIQCQRCNAWIQGNAMAGHEESCRKHPPRPTLKTPQSKPPPQKPTAHRQEHKSPTQLDQPHQPSKPTTIPPAPQPDRPHPQLVAASAIRDARIQAEVLRIAKEAWEATLELQPTARIKAAKQQALLLIAALSPSIKREVEHRFTSTKWAPLLALCPKDSESPGPILRPTPLNWPLPSPPE